MTHSHHIQPEKDESPALRTLLSMRAVQLLLAGMYFLFGMRFTKAEKTLQRERAIIMRKSIGAVNRVIETRKGNKDALSSFTNDYGPSWRERMASLSCVPGICEANIRDLRDTMCQIAGRSRLKAGNTIAANASWICWNGSFVSRAPP